MICEIDGRVLGDMQFGVLVQVLLELVVTVWALFCEIDGWVLGGMQFGVVVQMLFKVLVQVLFEVLVTV